MVGVATSSTCSRRDPYPPSVADTGEPVADEVAEDGKIATITLLHDEAHPSELRRGLLAVPACAEKRRAHAMDTLRGVLGTRRLTDSARWRALHAALARLTAQAPKRDRGLHRVVEFVRTLWSRLWGG